ncbi:MAG: hypothetical protein ACFN4S_09330, partial [Prevotella conceptionensis]
FLDTLMPLAFLDVLAFLDSLMLLAFQDTLGFLALLACLDSPCLFGSPGFTGFPSFPRFTCYPDAPRKTYSSFLFSALNPHK